MGAENSLNTIASSARKSVDPDYRYDLTTEKDREKWKDRYEKYKEVQSTLSLENIAELRRIYTSWYKINPADYDLIDIGLALVLDRRVPGDPVWGYVIGPSGFFKTGLCRSFSQLPEVYPLDTMTEKTLVSGLMEKKKGTDEIEPVAGILRDLDGKVLVVKDFTAILSLRDYKRQALLAQLRNAHDGYFDAGFGTRREPVREKASFGFVGAVTPIIDSYTKTLVTMGPRCLMVRIHDPPRRQSARAARENLGMEDMMREQIQYAVKHFTESLDFSKKIRVANSIGNRIDALADYTAMMRTHLMASYYAGRIVDHGIPSVEAPTRLSKQLAKLGIGLAHIRGHDEITDDDYRTLQRVGKDTAIPEFQLIIDHWLQDHETNGLDALYSASEIAINKRLNLNTTTNKLELMRIIGITEQDVSNYWHLSDYFKETIYDAGLVAVQTTL